MPALTRQSLTFAPRRIVLATVALTLCVSAASRAQPAVPAGPLDTPARDADQGKLAPPDQERAPDAAQATPDAAQATRRTPIAPPPRDAAQPAFRIYPELDLPLITLGLTFVSVRFIRTQPAFCAPLCDRDDVNALDRTTAGRFSPGWRTASNIGVVALGASAAAFLVADEGLATGLHDAFVIGESALSATAAATILTVAAGRPRPYLYGTRAPLADRTGTDAGNSFLSSHAAVSFAIATSTYIATHRRHPRSLLPYGVLGVGLGAAAFVGSARVLAGQHFITDVVGGAVVGSSFGVLIAALHRAPATLVPLVGETQRGLGVQGAF